MSWKVPNSLESSSGHVWASAWCYGLAGGVAHISPTARNDQEPVSLYPIDAVMADLTAQG